MKRFSEYFLDYVGKENLTWKEAAKLCGVDRTLLSRYASGKKLPDSLDKVLKIAKGLGMSRRQTEEFQLLYQIRKTGEYQHCALELIEQIFEGNAIQFGAGPKGEALEWEGQGRLTRRLNGKEEICGAIRHVAEEASYLRMHMNFSGLPSGIRFCCNTEHMIELDPMGRREEEIQELKRMLPHLYFGQAYKVYCHYRKYEEAAALEEQISMLLSDKVLILFTGNLERGICTYEAEYREYFGKVFSDNLKKCHLFGGSGCIHGADTDPCEADAFLENEASGISFWYEKLPYKRIWVYQKGNEKNGFYVEEAQLVEMFLIFMSMRQGTECNGEGV